MKIFRFPAPAGPITVGGTTWCSVADETPPRAQSEIPRRSVSRLLNYRVQTATGVSLGVKTVWTLGPAVDDRV